MKKFLKAFAVGLAGLAAFVAVLPTIPTPSVSAQYAGTNGVFLSPYPAKVVGDVRTAADTDPALYIKYFGPGGASTTTVAVEADGNLTFVVNGAAYTGFECPVSGALGGVIDVSDSACDTVGEVVDVINATAPTFSTGYFRAVIAAGLRSDSSDTRFLADAADTEVTRPQGDIIYYDSSVDDDTNLILEPVAKGFGGRVDGNRLPASGNPFKGSENVLLYSYLKITNAGTIGNTEVHCTVENYRDGASPGSEVDTILYLEAGGATTVAGVVDEFKDNGGLVCQEGKLWVRGLASAADTSAVSAFLYGYRRPFVNSR